MVRFSCFPTNIHCHKQKKEVQRSAESMSKASQDCSQVQGLKVSDLKQSYDNLSSPSVEQVTSPPIEHCQKSEEMDGSSSPETNIEAHQRTSLKKSQSLGSALDREGRVSSVIDSEEEICQDFSFDRFHEKSLAPESFQGNNNVVPNESIFSIGDMKQLDEGDEDLANQLPREYACDSRHHTLGTPPMIAKSYSSPNMGFFPPTSKESPPSHVYVARRCRSSEDLDALKGKRKTIQNCEVGFHAMAYQERYGDVLHNKCEDPSGDAYGYESYNYSNYGRDWTVSKMDEVDMMKKHEGESSLQNWNELPSREFKIKRIEEWVRMIDLEESSSLKDASELPHSIDRVKKGSYVLGSAATAKLDSKSTHGMEAAKNYVSSLTATSTSAQLANFGLIVIPFLSAFVNLKMLNLSGNAIVRITAGALPRGLHVLNLAKNNISAIEGLRELTRLRVLDLSYNRILRIGHGLASCSSLKELYLAGNKISEVEGLHRLLKLNTLDLRFNKISTAKCLGQLAANYSSLQAINLEGNPAQRNVGDEQLKKYLQGILPHLVYFNKQTIKASSSKELVDRSARSAIASHQLDRGLRSEHKLIRKGNHNVATSKASSSLGHVHRVQAVSSPKQSKDRLGRLPPTGSKPSHHHHYLDLGSKLLGLRSDLSMRRSRSEGNLGAS